MLRCPHRHHRLHGQPDTRSGTTTSSWPTYNTGQLYHFYLNADRTARHRGEHRARRDRANMDIETGPDGALWYMEGGGYQRRHAQRRHRSAAARRHSPQPTLPQPPGARGLAHGHGTSPLTIPGTGSQTFPETGKTVSGIFLDYWNSTAAWLSRASRSPT